MTTEQLRLTVAACAVAVTACVGVVTATFVVRADQKNTNDSSIAVSTKRLADAADRAHPAPLVLRAAEPVAIKAWSPYVYPPKECLGKKIGACSSK